MKPFNLEEAKSGKQVCTRDGRKVRLFCFDVNHCTYQIAGLMSDKDETEEQPMSWDNDGHYVLGQNHNIDLMMLDDEN